MTEQCIHELTKKLCLVYRSAINNTWALLQTSLPEKTGLCNRCIFWQYIGILLRLHITRRIPHT
jgi:hypothetical protein